MKKSYLLLAAAALTFVACIKTEIVQPVSNGELSVVPVNADAGIGTKGYVEGSQFVETYYNAIHASSKEGKQVLRTMQISSYLTPQNGEQKNYFVDKTYKKGESDNFWHNYAGDNIDPIYWPVGGTLDFLAYSVSAETSGAGSSQNVTAAWDETNAASKVVLTIPGENSQNDILFAGTSGIESSTGSTAVPMLFNHAQAWIEFALKGSVDASNPDGIVTLKRIELEDVYNAGTLTVSNNRGNTFAKWDFSDEIKQTVEVDNLANVTKLNGTAQYLDMLLPQQTKTAFVIYYTLGSSPKELSYRFTTDQKTWLMGEKYIYNINITTSEVTVAPTVVKWNDVKEYSYTVKVPTTIYAEDGTTVLGNVTPTFSPSADSFKKDGEEDENGVTTYTCDTWGAQITLTAEPAEGYVFKQWSDGATENPRTFTITEGVELPEAIFKGAIITIAPTEFGKVTINNELASSLEVPIGSEVELKATTGATFKFKKWNDGNTDATRTVTVNEDVTYTPYFEVGVEYVEIAGLKWATQNLAITNSGKNTWKKFTNANDDEIFVNGDYFQWAAYAGYCGNTTDADKGLLIYKSFTSTACGGGSDIFTFKDSKNFDLIYTPYYNGSSYTAYISGSVTLESSDDVASIIKGGDWRMPKSEEFKAMKDATYWAWADGGYYVFAADDIHEAGSRVGSVPSELNKYDALLFLPAAGKGNLNDFCHVGSLGFYWSGSLYSSDSYYAYDMSFDDCNVNPQDYGSYRNGGCSVRPVSDLE